VADVFTPIFFLSMKGEGGPGCEPKRGKKQKEKALLLKKKKGKRRWSVQGEEKRGGKRAPLASGWVDRNRSYSLLKGEKKGRSSIGYTLKAAVAEERRGGGPVSTRESIREGGRTGDASRGEGKKKSIHERRGKKRGKGGALSLIRSQKKNGVVSQQGEKGGKKKKGRNS